MTGYETYARIGALTRQGLTPAQIAADCGLDERTVRRWQGRRPSMSQSRWRGWSRWCRTWRGEFEEGEFGEAERELEEKTGRW